MSLCSIRPNDEIQTKYSENRQFPLFSRGDKKRTVSGRMERPISLLINELQETVVISSWIGVLTGIFARFFMARLSPKERGFLSEPRLSYLHFSFIDKVI